MRRWLVLLSFICVLTAGAAAYALVKANESNSEAADKDRLVLLERSIDRRTAELDRRLSRTGTEIDNQEARLRRAGENLTSPSSIGACAASRMTRRMRSRPQPMPERGSSASSAGWPH